MKITSVEFAYIKSFKNLKFDLEKTSVLVGQNDHGKSSILKAIDIVLNHLNEDVLETGALHPDMAEKLLPIFPVEAKARRITLNYRDSGKSKQLHVTVRTDLTFTVLENIERNAKTSKEAITILRELRKYNKFLLIPALRDSTSNQFQDLFSRMLKEYGLSKIIPQKAGGTPKEYRTLKDITDKISRTIKPYINDSLLPEIEKHFGFMTQHKLALKFNANVEDVGGWILDNLQLGFQLADSEDTTIALSEAGSGVQSGVLLALHRLEHSAAQNPNIQYILAVEEPEAFLHPQKQKELYQDIRSIQLPNFRVIVTTHSPYIVSETSFASLGLIKKEGNHSALHIPSIKDLKEQEMFDAYSSELNSSLLFSDKVIFVEGESDVRVLQTLLQKRYGAKAHRISVISAAGNKNFSPFLRMVRSWGTAKIPHLVVTDFDSLTKSCERAILKGAKDAGYVLIGEQSFITKVDNSLDKGESDFANAASDASAFFKASSLNVFVFTSDLEYSLISKENKTVASKILSSSNENNTDYSTGYDLNSLRRLIGSKGVPLNAMERPPFKKPFIHKKIAETIDISKCHPDIDRFFRTIDNL